MPYIKKENRSELQNIISSAEWTPPKTAGELNYLFTKIALIYVRTQSPSYQVYNDILGALEGAKLELYRRQISEYEDECIKKNGDL